VAAVVSAAVAVAQDKELNEVERGLHAVKDPIGMRPIWHRVERRVRAHIFGPYATRVYSDTC
jgi:hypothetical protein